MSLRPDIPPYTPGRTRPDLPLVDLHLLHQATGRLLLDLHALTERIANQRAYLKTPGADLPRGHADLAALHVQRTGLRCQVRANNQMIESSSLGESWE